MPDTAATRLCSGCGTQPAEVTHLCCGLWVPGTAVREAYQRATVEIEATDDE